VLALEIDARVPKGCVRIQAGTSEAATLGGSFGPITIERA